MPFFKDLFKKKKKKDKAKAPAKKPENPFSAVDRANQIAERKKRRQRILEMMGK